MPTMQGTRVRAVGREDPLEKEMAARSSILASQVVKNLPDTPGDISLIPGLGISTGGGNSNPCQCSCLRNPMDRGAWRDTVHRVAKGRT